MTVLTHPRMTNSRTQTGGRVNEQPPLFTGIGNRSPEGLVWVGANRREQLEQGNPISFADARGRYSCTRPRRYAITLFSLFIPNPQQKYPRQRASQAGLAPEIVNRGFRVFWSTPVHTRVTTHD